MGSNYDFQINIAIQQFKIMDFSKIHFSFERIQGSPPHSFLPTVASYQSPVSKKELRWLGTQHYKKLQNSHNSSVQNKLFRWLWTFNVTTTSHACQWKVADEWFGDDLIVEVAPFQSDVYDDTGHYKNRLHGVILMIYLHT